MSIQIYSHGYIATFWSKGVSPIIWISVRKFCLLLFFSAQQSCNCTSTSPSVQQEFRHAPGARARSSLLAALIRARAHTVCEDPLVIALFIRARSTEVRRPYCICKDYCSLFIIILTPYTHAFFGALTCSKTHEICHAHWNWRK